DLERTGADDHQFLVRVAVRWVRGFSRRERRDVDLEPAQIRRHRVRSEEHTSELQSRGHLVCRLLLEKKKNTTMAIKSARTIKNVLPSCSTPWTSCISVIFSCTFSIDADGYTLVSGLALVTLRQVCTA